MGRIRGKLIEGRIHRQPQSTAALVDVHLGPCVVIKSTRDPAHVHEADRDAGRNAERARHRDVQRRVLVAVSHLRPQNLAGRGQAHRRLLFEKRVHVTRQLLDARPVSLDAANRALRLFANLRGVAFDERLRLYVPQRIRIRRAPTQRLGVLNLDLSRLCGLARAREIRILEINAVEPYAQPRHVAGIIDAQRLFRNDRRHLQQVRLHAARDAHALRSLRRLAHRHESEWTLLLDDVAGVGDP